MHTCVCYSNSICHTFSISSFFNVCLFLSFSSLISYSILIYLSFFFLPIPPLSPCTCHPSVSPPSSCWTCCCGTSDWSILWISMATLQFLMKTQCPIAVALSLLGITDLGIPFTRMKVSAPPLPTPPSAHHTHPHNDT